MDQSLIELLPHIKKLQDEGKKIVFTNGVFDILHKGHVDYLNEASKLGDCLIVGINDDSSVRRLKGPTRPVNNQLDRSYIIANLKAVYQTFIFSEDTPYEAIKAIMPDVLVKGGDYDSQESDPKNSKYIVGSDLVKAKNGLVITINLTEGKSTTNIITKIQN